MPVARDQLLLALRENHFRLSDSTWYGLEEIARLGRALFSELTVSDLHLPLEVLVGQGILTSRFTPDFKREYQIRTASA